MTAVNTQLLHRLAELWRARGEASVTIDGGRIHRVLHIGGGELLWVDSDVHTERLGVQLVADWLLDARRVEELVAAARVRGRHFGEHLVAEGLITPQTMNAAVEKQCLQRFDRALTMPGAVIETSRLPTRVTLRRPLGPELFRAFRERLPVSAATTLVASLSPRHDRLHAQFLSPEDLMLTGGELRLFRQLASGQGVSSVLDRAPDYNLAVRFIGALVAIGALGGEEIDLLSDAAGMRPQFAL